MKFKVIETQTIIATGAELVNSRKLSHAADSCGTPIGVAVPSKALLVSFSAAEEAVVARKRRRSECRDRLRRRKFYRNSVISHVLAINLPLQPVLDKKVSGGPLLELAILAHMRHVTSPPELCNAPDSDAEYPRIPTIAFRSYL